VGVISPFVDALLMRISPIQIRVEVSEDPILFSVVAREINAEFRIKISIVSDDISLVGGMLPQPLVTAATHEAGKRKQGEREPCN
jgi:hypothetical protein